MERDEEDDLLDSYRRALARRAAEHDAQVVEELAAGFEDDGTVAPGGPPRPLYWHPFYRDRTELMDWLDSSSNDRRYIPLPKPIRYANFRQLDEQEIVKPIEHELLTLTKQVAGGPAPYVGEPFMYRWNVATDQYGRSIAGEARIMYRYGFPLYGGVAGV